MIYVILSEYRKETEPNNLFTAILYTIRDQILLCRDEMRETGQIGWLCAFREPDVLPAHGVITPYENISEHRRG